MNLELGSKQVHYVTFHCLNAVRSESEPMYVQAQPKFVSSLMLCEFGSSKILILVNALHFPLLNALRNK